MKHDQMEIAAVLEVIVEDKKAQLSEISDLQLALVGGGIADTMPF